MQPTRLGPYTIRGRLGRGGMGTVYEAVDQDGAAVAVKTLTAHLGDDTSLRRRFEAEIEALKSLQHPGIVRLLAFGEEEGCPFFAMELVRGRSLEEFLKEGRRFDWRETVAVATAVARALKAAHDRGIVHRDLKPANLLFPEEPGGSVKLADFGIARLFGDSGQTQAGMVVGTAEYMAPEQAAAGPVDLRADLYALGLVIFAMLVGRPPFRGGSVSEVLRRQRRETPPPVSAIVPEVPEPLERLIEKLLAKDPADRPASALAVGRSLAQIEGLPEPAGNGAGDRASQSPTRPGSGSGSTLPASGSSPPPAVDLLAATQAGIAAEQGTRSVAGAGRAAGEAATLPFSTPTAADRQSLAHRLTESDSPGAAGVSAAVSNRFTTVEDLERLAQAEARQAANRDGLVRWAVAALLLAAVFVAGYAVLKPATADQLHERIAALAADPAADLRDARPLIDLFLARFPADPRVAEIRDLERRLDLDALERRMRRRPREGEVLAPIERDYRAAMDRKAESPLACVAALEAILTLYGREPDADAALWLALVQRQIDQVTPLAEREREEDVARAAATLAEAHDLAAAAATATDETTRADLLARRRDLLAGVMEIYASRPHVEKSVAEAQRLLAAADPDPPESAPRPESSPNPTIPPQP